MTKRHSADVGFFLLGAYDLTSISSKLEYGASSPVQDTTPFGVSSVAYDQPGITTYTVSGHEGWYDDASYTAASTMVALTAGEHVLMLADRGNVVGREAVCIGGTIAAGLGIPFTVGDFHRARIEATVSGVLDHATIVAALASVAGDGNSEGAYVDLGADGGGTTGANVYVACTALDLDGSTNLVVTLEDSADHAAWADHTVMTALTAVGAEKKTATDATVNRYVAAKRAFTDIGATSPTATIVLAVKVNDPHA